MTDDPGDGTRWKLARRNGILLWSYVEQGQSPLLTREDCLDEIRRAFQIWQPYFPLEFVEVEPENPNIGIAIGWYKIDNAGQVLGQAELPLWHYPRVCRLWMDTDEKWEDEASIAAQNSRPHFGTVMQHEIGHTLGLEHLPLEPHALMSPYYQGPLDATELDFEALVREYHAQVEAMEAKGEGEKQAPARERFRGSDE